MTRSTTPGDAPGWSSARLTRLAQGALAAIFWLAVWQIAAWAVGHEVLLVSPWQALRRLGELVRTGAFWGTVGFSLGRIGLG
ncbi:MAG: hypothetical protein LBR19_00430, partial [Bifidobacteriaceae bacterium]|nr:hypothetical protein [Bifidobacteriaceae bacterium]